MGFSPNRSSVEHYWNCFGKMYRTKIWSRNIYQHDCAGNEEQGKPGRSHGKKARDRGWLKSDCQNTKCSCDSQSINVASYGILGDSPAISLLNKTTACLRFHSLKRPTTSRVLIRVVFFRQSGIRNKCRTGLRGQHVRYRDVLCCLRGDNTRQGILETETGSVSFFEGLAT